MVFTFDLQEPIKQRHIIFQKVFTLFHLNSLYQQDVQQRMKGQLVE
jgi:hypothetical protein